MRSIRARPMLTALATAAVLIISLAGPGARAGTAPPAAQDRCPALDTKPVALGPEGSTPFNQPTFSWRPVPGIDEYVVLVLLESDDEQTVWLGHAKGTTSITPPPLPVNTPMRWRVKSECDEQYSEFSNQLYFTAEPEGAAACPLPAPAVLGPQPGRIGDPRPTFSWAPVPGASSYTVHIQSGTSDAIIASELDIRGTTYTPPSPLPVGVPLRWKVKAESGCATQPYSPIVYFDIGPTNPCGLVGPATPYGPQGTLIRNRPLFRWGDAPNASAFTLYVVRRDTGAPVLIETVWGTTYLPPTNLPAGVPLRWSVQGYNPCGDGQYSAAPQFAIR